jgi:L-aminopeptidase/D-esterase-like protein
MAGGVGSHALRLGPWTVGALAVVNALGDVLDGSGSIVAGARAPDGSFLDTARVLRSGGGQGAGLAAARNTTLAVVATDAPLSRVELKRLSRMAWTALPRRISPVGTPFDGDVVFTASTGPLAVDVSPGELLALGTVARDALEEAITGAVGDQPSRA